MIDDPAIPRIWEKIKADPAHHTAGVQYNMIKVIAEFHHWRNVRWSSKHRDDYDIIGDWRIPTVRNTAGWSSLVNTKPDRYALEEAEDGVHLILKGNIVPNYFEDGGRTNRVESFIGQAGLGPPYLRKLYEVTDTTLDFDAFPAVCAHASARAYALYLTIKENTR